MVNINYLDLIDKKLLYELDLNSRIPVTKLSKKLRISRERANYRINNLVKRGIIRKFVCMINPSKLGYSIYKLYFKFQNLTPSKEDEIISWLIKNPFVYWVANAQGKWDMNITVFSKDINSFDETLSQFTSKFGRFILDQEFNTTLWVGILSKDWLFRGLRSRMVRVGGEISDLRIDKVDVEILRILANNARMSSTEIARKINSSERRVIYRIKKLEELGIILGYTTSLNLGVLGMQFFKAIVNFRLLAKEDKAGVVDYCRSNPHIGFFIFCAGSWPLELELIVKDNDEYFRVMEDFRRKFPNVKCYETILLPKEHKFDWMPLCYRAK